MFGEAAAAALHQCLPSSALTPVDSRQPLGILKVAPLFLAEVGILFVLFPPEETEEGWRWWEVLWGEGEESAGECEPRDTFISSFFFNDILPLLFLKCRQE